MAVVYLAVTFTLAYLVVSGFSATVEVGGASGWKLGILYPPTLAAAGDSLVFQYELGQHNVVQLPGPSCRELNQGRQLAGLTASPYTYQVPVSGPLYFACGVEGHCDAGMLLTVNVAGSSVVPAIAPSGIIPPAQGPLPYGAARPPAGPIPPGFTPQPLVPEFPGYCEDAEPSSDPQTPDYFTRTCYSPGLNMGPGDVINWFYALPNPYPLDQEVAVVKQASQVVDEDKRSVPLSEIYTHHFYGSSKLITGEGAELRGTESEPPFPGSYYLRANGSEVDPTLLRLGNIHFINTLGVQQNDLQPCIECWCRNPEDVAGGTAGGTACCTSLNCPTKFAEGEAPGNHTYYLQYNVTYRFLTMPAEKQDTLQQVLLDVRNGSVEHDIHRQLPGDLVNVTARGPLDSRCPQIEPFGIVRCVAHQHIGGQCITLLLEDGSTVCQSCPTYGNSSSVGEPGNEHGYIVKIAGDTLQPPAYIEPGAIAELVSTYDASTDHFGVMSLFVLDLVNWDPTCPGPAPTELVFGPPGGPNAPGGDLFGIVEGKGIYPPS